MIEIGGAVVAGMLLLPWCAYLCAKAITFGVYRGRQAFHEYSHIKELKKLERRIRSR